MSYHRIELGERDQPYVADAHVRWSVRLRPMDKATAAWGTVTAVLILLWAGTTATFVATPFIEDGDLRVFLFMEGVLGLFLIPLCWLGSIWGYTLPRPRGRAWVVPATVCGLMLLPCAGAGAGATPLRALLLVLHLLFAVGLLHFRERQTWRKLLDAAAREAVLRIQLRLPSGRPDEHLLLLTAALTKKSIAMGVVFEAEGVLVLTTQRLLWHPQRIRHVANKHTSEWESPPEGFPLEAIGLPSINEDSVRFEVKDPVFSRQEHVMVVRIDAGSAVEFILPDSVTETWRNRWHERRSPQLRPPSAETLLEAYCLQILSHIPAGLGLSASCYELVLQRLELRPDPPPARPHVPATEGPASTSALRPVAGSFESSPDANSEPHTIGEQTFPPPNFPSEPASLAADTQQLGSTLNRHVEEKGSSTIVWIIVSMLLTVGGKSCAKVFNRQNRHREPVEWPERERRQDEAAPHAPEPDLPSLDDAYARARASYEACSPSPAKDVLGCAKWSSTAASAIATTVVCEAASGKLPPDVVARESRVQALVQAKNVELVSPDRAHLWERVRVVEQGQTDTVAKACAAAGDHRAPPPVPARKVPAFQPKVGATYEARASIIGFFQASAAGTLRVLEWNADRRVVEVTVTEGDQEEADGEKVHLAGERFRVQIIDCADNTVQRADGTPAPEGEAFLANLLADALSDSKAARLEGGKEIDGSVLSEMCPGERETYFLGAPTDACAIPLTGYWAAKYPEDQGVVAGSGSFCLDPKSGLLTRAAYEGKLGEDVIFQFEFSIRPTRPSAKRKSGTSDGAGGASTPSPANP